MGPTPDSRPGRMPQGNSFEAQVARALTQPFDSTKPANPVTRKTIEVPGIPPINVESHLGKTLQPLLASGGEVQIEEAVSASGMGRDEFEAFAEHYQGVLGINRQKGTVFSPPVIEARQKQDGQAA